MLILAQGSSRKPVWISHRRAGYGRGVEVRVGAGVAVFLKIQVLGCLNTPQAACPSCDLLNACNLESSSVLESIIVENVTCNPLSLHSAGQVIDFQKKKKLTVLVLGGQEREKLLLSTVKCCLVRLWLCLGGFSGSQLLQRGSWWFRSWSLMSRCLLPRTLCAEQGRFISSSR